MKLTRSSLWIAVGGRGVTAQGEALLPGHGGPDFVLYTNTIEDWDDGSPIDAEDKKKILAQVMWEARQLGIDIELES